MSERRASIAAISFFVLAMLSRELFRLLPAPWGGVAWQSSWVLFCLVGLFMSHGLAPGPALRELGLRGSAAKGLGLAFLTTIPMALVLALTANEAPTLDTSRLVRGALLAGFAEELLFRGYLFIQLHRRAGWRWPWAVLATGLLFGLAHIPTAMRQGFTELLLVVLITTAGGMYFAWLLLRWRFNLWLPIGLHIFMNASWEIFATSLTGGLAANLARAASIALVVVVTLRRTVPVAAKASSVRSDRGDPSGDRIESP